MKAQFINFLKHALGKEKQNKLCDSFLNPYRIQHAHFWMGKGPGSKAKQAVGRIETSWEYPKAKKEAAWFMAPDSPCRPGR